MLRLLATFVLCSLLAGPALAVQAVVFKSTGQSSVSGPPYPTPPIFVDLGREIGGADTKTGSIRNRGFYIIDRSTPAALEPGGLRHTDGILVWTPSDELELLYGNDDKSALSLIPALSASDIEYEVLDNNGVLAQFVARPGLPAGTYHQVTTTATTVEFTYGVDLGDGGVTELTTHCECLAGYVISNVQLTTTGPSSAFHLVFDMDGPGGENSDPMLSCTTTGTFTEGAVAVEGA